MHSVGHLPADSEIDTPLTGGITTTSKPSALPVAAGLDPRRI